MRDYQIIGRLTEVSHIWKLVSSPLKEKFGKRVFILVEFFTKRINFLRKIKVLQIWKNQNKIESLLTPSDPLSFPHFPHPFQSPKIHIKWSLSSLESKSKYLLLYEIYCTTCGSFKGNTFFCKNVFEKIYFFPRGQEGGGKAKIIFFFHPFLRDGFKNKIKEFSINPNGHNHGHIGRNQNGEPKTFNLKI